MSDRSFRRVPSRRITRRLSFSSPSSKKSRDEQNESANSSPKTPVHSPVGARSALDDSTNFPTTPKSSRSLNCSSLTFDHNNSFDSFISDNTMNISTPSSSSVNENSYPNLRDALMKSRRKLYMEQMFKERRAIRQKNLELQKAIMKKNEIMKEIKTLRL